MVTSTKPTPPAKPASVQTPAAAPPWQPTENDLIGDLLLRVVALTPGFSAAIAQQVEREAREHWGGDRVYIARRSGADHSARNQAIRADHARGERIEFLERRYQLSRRRIYCILGQPESA